jgi:DNA (cytosine-5)-methyltransferase 1
MWDVCRFAEAHQYRIVIVENVVEARHWAPFDAWLHAMWLLGYDHTIVYLNSMHAHPTPQSRDRMYVVFWQRALRTPHLRITPRAWCGACTRDVDAVQSWKNPQKPWGKYRQQYVYRCPACTREVAPYYYCAANAIDWTLPAPRIGARARPLKEKTLQRIRLGLEQFGAQAQIVGNDSPGWARPVTDPTGTITTQDHHALLTPPPFLLDLAYTHGQDARVTPAGDPAATQTTRQTHAVVVPPYLIDLRGANAPKALVDALATVCATGNYHGLVLPFVTSYHRADDGIALTEALPTQDTRDRHALVAPPFLMGIHTAVSYRALSDSLQTVVGAGNHHFLAHPGATPAVEECGFRMLQPHEIGRAMAFPRDYVVLGTQREQVKQYGNAVTPPVMRLLVERCLEVLG